MKGQLVFEFVIAAFILFGIILFSINNLASYMNLYHTNYLSNFQEGRAMQISEILLNDPKTGIVDEWPVLNEAKMGYFNTTCSSDYINLLMNFSMIEDLPYPSLHHMRVIVNATDGQVFVRCGREPPSNITTATVTRFGFIPPPTDKVAIIEVRVW
ncbi:MAG: hypothetical protein JXC85_03215 [Candidatus Aenigmarchaeota archaeon]|nr:hypothetical protein [Candidatus Aenigmarchaeota archaeon]